MYCELQEAKSNQISRLEPDDAQERQHPKRVDQIRHPISALRRNRLHPWPEDRKVVDLGVLTLTQGVPNSLEAQKKLLFVPTNLTAGIELSDDPLPSVRAAAYGVSFARRSQPNSHTGVNP
jgi:hypothetical protein